MSDAEIVRRSPGRIGILDNLEKGDVVMADKGFRDKSDFLLKGLQTSIIPEFSKKGGYLYRGK